jgi:hypothetical protein
VAGDINNEQINYLLPLPFSSLLLCLDGTAVLSAVRIRRQNPVTSRIVTKSLSKHCSHTVYSLFTHQPEEELLRIHEKRTQKIKVSPFSFQKNFRKFLNKLEPL